MRDLDSKEASQRNRDDLSGSIVDAVVVDSPADKAGLKVGDLVVAVNGEAVADSSKLKLLIGSIQAGKEAKFTVQRGSKAEIVKVTLSDRESEQANGYLRVYRDR
jgi:S1-C subfamily serine protease